MSLPVIHSLPCALCVIAILAVYAHRFVREWREYHPKPAPERVLGESSQAEFPGSQPGGGIKQFA